MIYYELWLDESGDFLSDDNSALNPSLVGGILIKKNAIDDIKAKEILGKNYAHFNNEKADYALKILQDIKKEGGQFVIFSNQERVLIVDQDITYLNILAEGIIQLLLKLSAKYGDFRLDIVVATRKNTVSSVGIIAPEEYKKRLKERVFLGIARKVLTRKNKWNYDVYFDDARTNKKLMLADGVCNTYLTRTSAKFTQLQKETISTLYDDGLFFSLFENSTEKEILRWIAEGKVSESLFEIYMNSEGFNRTDLLKDIINRLKDYDGQGRKNKLLAVSAMIEAYIKINQDFIKIKKVLIDMQNDLLAELRKNGLHVPEFFLDIILYLYTIYTHEGSIKAEEQDYLFMEELRSVTDIVVKFHYFHTYKIRRGIHQKNMLDIQGSINNFSQAIKVLEEMVELMTILDNQSGESNPKKYELLGKGLGSRGQAYTMLISKDLLYLDLAVKDFEEAIEQFAATSDQERQYVYLSQAYCEGGVFDKALWALCKSCHIEYKGLEDLNSLMAILASSPIYQVIYKIYSYIKIMAYAKEKGQDTLAETMYATMHKYQFNVESLKNKYSNIHPLQFIFWHMASFLFLKGDRKRAKVFLESAIATCSSEDAGTTIQIMVLGMYGEMILHHLETGPIALVEEYQKKLFLAYREIKSSVNVPTILNYIECLEDVSLENINREVLRELSRVVKNIN